MRRRQKNQGRYESGPVNVIDMGNYGNVPLNQLWPGRIVTAHVPFRDDPNQSKSRPAIVGRVQGRNITLFPIYSGERPWRTEIDHHGRRCYVDLHPVVVDRINLVGLDPTDVSDDVLELLLKHLDA